eukprot:Partr_v1_DN23923_c0_g2_i1_m49058 putative cleavage and polyadenylation specificity factor
MNQDLKVKLYPLDNYTFVPKDPSDSAAEGKTDLPALQEPMLRSTDCVVVTHKHGHPHLLLLQLSHSYFKLPSGEGDVNTIMTDVLVPAGVIADFESVRIGRWYKHTAESIYPYLPPHIKQPREIRDIMLVKLPPSMVFGVPKNLKVAAVPLFEVYENHSRYGPIIANVPFMLSQFEFENVEATLQPSKQLQ